MAVINILSKQVAELIAAGEVIERPASVIKELVENSIDAGAAAVTVEIKNGGVTFMRVTDNGCGIERDDVKNAFLRHATSKISVQNDLDSIDTLGFRGEALASICAVSRVELMTKSVKEDTGTLYRLEGGIETEFRETGCPNGTTFVVRDLFYNVPARMKFLKKDASESNNVSMLMDRMALSHPEIGFTFIRDGKQAMKTAGKGDLGDAVFQVFGKQFFESLIPVSYEYQGIKLRGFVSKPVSANRASRSMQVFCVNGRYVRTKTAMAALEQAYKGFIMVGKYPACVLDLEMDCSTLDVNVHPAKLEIRFTNERPVYECVYHGVRTAVSEYDTRNSTNMKPDFQTTDPKLLGRTADRGVQLGFSTDIPSKKPEDDEPEVFMPAPADYSVQSVNDPSSAAVNYYNSGRVNIRQINLAEYRSQREQEKNNTAAPKPSGPSKIFERVREELISEKNSLTSEPEQEEKTDFSPEKPDDSITLSEIVSDINSGMTARPAALAESAQEKTLRFVGEAFLTYIIVEYDRDRLMFIDKHAAHERIIYERLKRTEQSAEQQLLLEPIAVTLDKEDLLSVTENREMLLKAGFDVEEFGSGTVLIRGVPIMLEKLDITEAFLEIAKYLTKHKRLVLSEKMEWIYANTACRAAIKAGDRNTPEELIALVKELEKNPDVKYCPHGRPIWFFMSRSEMEKNFKRI